MIKSHFVGNNQTLYIKFIDDSVHYAVIFMQPEDNKIFTVSRQQVNFLNKTYLMLIRLGW